MAKETPEEQAARNAEESAEAREHALLATPQGQAEKDTLPDPHVGAVHAPYVDVVYNDDVQGMYLGEPIEPGKAYRMTIAEATAVMTAMHGSIVGTEPDDEREKRVAAHLREVERETKRQAKGDPTT